MVNEIRARDLVMGTAKKEKSRALGWCQKLSGRKLYEENEKGDECLFYSSVSEKAIKGIMTVVKEYYPDPTDQKGIFGMVDVKYVKNLKEVTLAEIKADPFFDDFPLVKQSRLSVMPVKLNQWKKLLKMTEK